MDYYRKYIIRKLQARQHEDLLLSESKLVEKEALNIEFFFTDFDSTFLDIYPHFVKNINSFLKEDGRYILKRRKDEESFMLNTELRILALLKLGIVDNKAIASFLRVTVQTVYNYRSKIKSKAIDEDSFEDNIMEM